MRGPPEGYLRANPQPTLNVPDWALREPDPLPLSELRVLLHGSDTLVRRAQTVVWVNPALRRLIATMRGLVQAWETPGLAAPVIGFDHRLAAVQDGDRIVILINPRLIERSGRLVCRLETCWCYPGIQASVLRSPEVVLEAFDLEGRLFQMKAEGQPAFAIQHELDHLFGILLPERAIPDSFVWRVLIRTREGRERREAYPTTLAEIERFYDTYRSKERPLRRGDGFLSQEEWEVWRGGDAPPSPTAGEYPPR